VQMAFVTLQDRIALLSVKQLRICARERESRTCTSTHSHTHAHTHTRTHAHARTCTHTLYHIANVGVSYRCEVLLNAKSSWQPGRWEEIVGLSTRASREKRNDCGVSCEQSVLRLSVWVRSEWPVEAVLRASRMGVVGRCHAQERRALSRGSAASGQQDDVLGMLDGNNQPKNKKERFCFLTTSAAIATRCGGGGAYSAGAAREGCCCCLRRLGTRSLPRFSSVSLPAWRMACHNAHKGTQHSPTQQRSCKKGPKTHPFLQAPPAPASPPPHPHTHLQTHPSPQERKHRLPAPPSLHFLLAARVDRVSGRLNMPPAGAATVAGAAQTVQLQQALFAAVRAGDVGATEKAVLDGASLTATDPRTGHTPLSIAFELCKTDVRAICAATLLCSLHTTSIHTMTLPHCCTSTMTHPH
jgi:hypothetical protein